jgi:hypothetical protein
MKLEYFPAGSTDCPLILLYEPSKETIIHFCSQLKPLINCQHARIAVHTLFGFQSVAACRLYLAHAEKDQGVSPLADEPNSFLCHLKPETWSDFAEYLAPFAEQTGYSGFQWLSTEGKIKLLISTHRGW